MSGTKQNRIRAGWVKQGVRGLYFAAFAVLLALMFWRCRYGYASPDESFYLITPLRLIQGGRMLLDEWHMSQFSSFTMVPAVWLHLRLVGNTEGMLLAFRYIYTAAWAASALFLYFRVRKLQEGGAMCASLMLLCYAPFGIMAFSYNSLGILFLLNSILFLLRAERARKAQWTVSGLFFAGAVLCCPYLAAVYLGYSLFWAVRKIKNKKSAIMSAQAEGDTRWRWFTLGVCVLAVLFLSALFAGNGPERVWRSLGYAMGDEEHATFSFLQKTAEYFRSIAGANPFLLPALALMCVLAVLNRFRRSGLWLCLTCGAVMVCLKTSLRQELYLNYLMLPLTLAGIYVMGTTRKPEIRRVGALWLIPGVLYTFCLNYSSNMAYYAISSAATVSSLAGLLMLWMHCGELREAEGKETRRKYLRLLPYAAVVVCFAFQMRYEIPLRIQSVFQEQGLMTQAEKMELAMGPQRGILTSPENAAEYNRIYEEISDIREEKVLFLCDQNWMYLMNDNRVAAFSAWLGSINGGWIREVSDETLRRLTLYYEERPEQRPEVIFLGRENIFLLEENYFWMDGEVETLPEGDVLIRMGEKESSRLFGEEDPEAARHRRIDEQEEPA